MNKIEIPEFFVEKLKNQYGEEIYNQIINGLYLKKKSTFRINTIKTEKEEIEAKLNLENIQFKKIDTIENAYEIDKEDESKIRELDIYKEGKIYVQNLSSMIPPIILDPKEGQDILDMAAAPGGKTTQMASITNNKAHITACELNKIRFERLKYNVEKQGASCIYCMQKDARNIDDFFSFNQILLDAPCSGSGTLDLENQNTFKYFTEKLISKSVEAQKALLNKAIKILKSGGEMVYSTCSILSCENEEIVNEALRTNKIEIIPIENNFIKNIPLLPTKIPGTLCIMPNEYFEGFFVAKLRKNSSNQ